ncbi:protease [Musa troglodytarum]|uniref:Protease n=1 Tax=Musa troglodytarum TaxID=320322 RepID=A0A9E7I4Q2_9LILI|nr:protease [Musa troglodytarum]
MGALTENRKRRLAVDFRLPFSPHPVFDLAAEPSPPSKKARFPSPPVETRPLTSPTPAAGTPSSPLRRFPPAAPLPRPVHAPQRILRAFGLGSAHPSRSRLPESSPTQERDSEMGNLVARFLQGKKVASFTPWRTGKRGDASARPHGSQGSEDNDGCDEVLGLDQYKKLVNSVQERNLVVSDRKSVEAVFAPTPSGLSELTIVTPKPEQTPNLHLVNRKVEDARKLVVESTSLWEKAPVSRSPLYKELYMESARRHDSKLRNLELEVKLAEQKVSSFRFAHQGQETNIKEDLNDAFLPLTDEEEEDVYRALNGRNSHEVLVVHEPSNIEITREVLQCLSRNAWLNDELTSGRNGYDYKAVRRWTTQKKLGYNLVECDKIFVPIHREVHWCLAIIDVKKKKFQYLDSLGGMDTTVLQVLARYFTDEVKDKSEDQVDALSWNLEAVHDLPLQKNGWDCGMFMLKYADFYSRDLSLCFDQENMPYFRKRTAKEILRLRAE